MYLIYLISLIISIIGIAVICYIKRPTRLLYITICIESRGDTPLFAKLRTKATKKKVAAIQKNHWAIAGDKITRIAILTEQEYHLHKDLERQQMQNHYFHNNTFQF